MQICGRNGKRSNRTLRDEVRTHSPDIPITTVSSHETFISGWKQLVSDAAELKETGEIKRINVRKPLNLLCCASGAAKPAERGQPHLPARHDVGLCSVRLGTRLPDLHIPVHHLQLSARCSNAPAGVTDTCTDGEQPVTDSRHLFVTDVRGA